MAIAMNTIAYMIWYVYARVLELINTTMSHQGLRLLANFTILHPRFNSLLHRRAGTPYPPATSTATPGSRIIDASIDSQAFKVEEGPLCRQQETDAR
ncbi:hypothetical protein BDN70DRAFT_888942 [Pholiota conissans]|uniref:Uncharacterized protein n=1 Tax=Pholiota conissans TaxID=109636 RepID=A0A9P6CQW5_9AGAR|nr:hypothetical protein BDN70DRAFT_888942 [Pholiota conissans]